MDGYGSITLHMYLLRYKYIYDIYVHISFISVLICVSGQSQGKE